HPAPPATPSLSLHDALPILRQLPGRRRAVAAAVRAARGPAPAGARAHPRVSLRARLPGLRRPGAGLERGGRQLGQGGRHQGAGAAGSGGLSALAKQLAGLRRQAGAASAIRPVDSTPAPAPSTPGPASTADQVARLRKLLGLRPRALATVHSLDRRLDGIELAPGLRLIESWVPFQR